MLCPLSTRPHHTFTHTQQTPTNSAAFASSQVLGVQEEVQLREQDFGNFQRVEDKQREKEERLRFGRFFYR